MRGQESGPRYNLLGLAGGFRGRVVVVYSYLASWGCGYLQLLMLVRGLATNLLRCHTPFSLNGRTSRTLNVGAVGLRVIGPLRPEACMNSFFATHF